MLVVHVIPPPGQKGDRHEERFPAGTPREKVLELLTRDRPAPDGRGVLPPLQDGYGRLADGRAYLDHPGTRVVVGTAEGKVFQELETIQGPPAGGP